MARTNTTAGRAAGQGLRRGTEFRYRAAKGQHFRVAGSNLLTAIIIYRNSVWFDSAVQKRKRVDKASRWTQIAGLNGLDGKGYEEGDSPTLP